MTAIDPFEPGHFEQIDQHGAYETGEPDDLTPDEIAEYERVGEALLDAEAEARRAEARAEEDDPDGPL